MVLRRILASASCLFWMVFVTPPSSAQDNCKDILNAGIYDYRVQGLDYSNAASFINWFRSNYSSESASSQSRNTSAGGSYGLYSARFDQSVANAAFQETQTAIQQYNEGQSNQILKIINLANTVNPFIVKAWSDCMDRAGFNVSYKLRTEPSQITMIFSYKKPFVRMTQDKVRGKLKPKNLKCDRLNFEVGVDPRNKRSGAQQTISCTRVKPNEAATVDIVDVNWDKTFDSTIDFPAIKTNKPPAGDYKGRRPITLAKTQYADCKPPYYFYQEKGRLTQEQIKSMNDQTAWSFKDGELFGLADKAGPVQSILYCTVALQQPVKQVIIGFDGGELDVGNHSGTGGGLYFLAYRDDIGPAYSNTWHDKKGNYTALWTFRTKTERKSQINGSFEADEQILKLGSTPTNIVTVGVYLANAWAGETVITKLRNPYFRFE